MLTNSKARAIILNVRCEPDIICECAGIGRQARLRGVCLRRMGSSPITRTTKLRNSVRVALVPLTHSVRVRILLPQPTALVSAVFLFQSLNNFLHLTTFCSGRYHRTAPLAAKRQPAKNSCRLLCSEYKKYT